MSALDKLLGKGNVTYHIAVAEAMNSVAAAIFLEQIAFWQARSEDGWAFRSVEQIQEYTGLKKDAQQGARRILMKAGVLEEDLRGMPARMYYRVDLDTVANKLAGTRQQVDETLQHAGGNPPTSKREPANRSIEGGEREDYSPTGSVPEAHEQEEKERIVPRSQWLTTQLYDNLRDTHKVRLSRDEFSTKVGQFEDVLKNDEPTDEEVERMLKWMIETWPKKEKTPHDAIKAVRLGRDTGEAWSGPAPWEGQNEPMNPHGEKAEKTKDKPYNPAWYATRYGWSWDKIDELLENHNTHTGIMEAMGASD